MKKIKHVIALSLVPLLAVPPSTAGIREPRKYYGVVLFDRWQGCYIVAGAYLMYVSEKTKGKLRQYDGKSVIVDAKEVSQPMNPGDGLIMKIGSIQVGGTEYKYTPVEAFVLELSRDSSAAPGRNKQVILHVTNTSRHSAELFPAELAFHAFTVSRHKWPDPSDGPSTAFYTRHTLMSYVGSPESPEVHVAEPKLETRTRIEPGKTLSISLDLAFPVGDYDLVASYGGEVLESKAIASDMLAITVDSGGEIVTSFQHIK